MYACACACASKDVCVSIMNQRERGGGYEHGERRGWDATRIYLKMGYTD